MFPAATPSFSYVPLLDRAATDFIYISAGTVDAPTGVKGAGHIWLSEKGDYYEISDDLPKAEGSSKGQFLGTPHE